MAEASHRAARGRAGNRLANACFLVEAAESLPGPLAGSASLVTVTLPWGSLLRGVLGLDAMVLRGVASIVAPDGRVEVLVSVVPDDQIAGFEALDREAEAGIGAAWAAVGFELVSMRPGSLDEPPFGRSSWARRLGDRSAWRMEFHPFRA
jgi:16S rRNA (adenine(1408)-N(1))-methyltransferase